jgi:VTC domain
MHFEQRFGAREIKFLVTPERAEEIRAWARTRLEPDPHAGGGETYRITSLYFDTACFDVFHARGSYGRAKYRVRRYDDAPTVFVERKMRTDSLVSKRRVAIGIEEMPRIAAKDEKGAWSGGWFQRRVGARQLNPVCAITYLRTAMVGKKEDGTLLRMTLDEAVRADRVDSLTMGEPSNGQPIVVGQQILELKYLGEMPGVFKELLATFSLNRIAVSKYRTAAAALGLAARNV